MLKFWRTRLENFSIIALWLWIFGIKKHEYIDDKWTSRWFWENENGS